MEVVLDRSFIRTPSAKWLLCLFDFSGDVLHLPVGMWIGLSASIVTPLGEILKGTISSNQSSYISYVSGRRRKRGSAIFWTPFSEAAINQVIYGTCLAVVGKGGRQFFGPRFQTTHRRPDIAAIR